VSTVEPWLFVLIESTESSPDTVIKILDNWEGGTSWENSKFKLENIELKMGGFKNLGFDHTSYYM